MTFINRISIATIATLLLTEIFSAGSHASTTQPAVPDPPTTQIAIDNFSFLPAQITITAGTRVTWTNHDDVIHTATSDVKPPVFNTGVLDTDQTYSFVFDKPGIYTYYCKVHPHMTGKITVMTAK
jgi:plastocyanin